MNVLFIQAVPTVAAEIVSYCLVVPGKGNSIGIILLWGPGAEGAQGYPHNHYQHPTPRSQSNAASVTALD